MQQITKNEIWAEEGCFVYRVSLVGHAMVRNSMSVGDEAKIADDQYFAHDELFSVDLVQPSLVPDSQNGPFLRLSDRSGWLFERKYEERVAERIPVVSGLWTFYVDNAPVGQALRKHPTDRSEKVDYMVTYQPMQRIYCDKKVVHPTSGVCFYRVQGTFGWVFDRRKNNDGEDNYMLLEESRVETGLFAYKCLCPLAVRSRAQVGEDTKTPLAVGTGAIVIVNAVRQSPFNHGNGPFLRLTDGSGWLFENKRGKRMMEEIPIERGNWKFQVLNPAGLALRRQPADDERKYPTLFAQHDTIACDRRLVAPSTGVSFYRVKSTTGWVFDRRGDSLMLKCVGAFAQDAQHSCSASSGGWSPDFVRGMASMVEGLEEIMFNEESRVISFRDVDGVRFNVYYTTRTVGTAMEHPSQGSTKLFRRDCSSKELAEIFRNPRFHSGRGYKRTRRTEDPDYVGSVSAPAIRSNEDAEEEESIRQDVLETERKIQSLQQTRMDLLKAVKRRFDDPRAETANSMKLKTQARQNEREIALEQQREAERREEMQRETARREKVKRTCSACSRVFSNQHALNQHTRDIHTFECPQCDREFQSEQSLWQHQNALGHWYD